MACTKVSGERLVFGSMAFRGFPLRLRTKKTWWLSLLHRIDTLLPYFKPSLFIVSVLLTLFVVTAILMPSLCRDDPSSRLLGYSKFHIASLHDTSAKSKRPMLSPVVRPYTTWTWRTSLIHAPRPNSLLSQLQDLDFNQRFCRDCLYGVLGL